MEMKFCSLSSGSSGNCQYIETENSRILIDAGFSGKRVQELLKSIDVCPTTIDGIFITHEHIDHIQGVGVLSRRFDIPIYANKNTWLAMEDKIGKIADKNIVEFNTDEYINHKDIDIKPIKIYHDAAEPVGYLINKGNKKISVVTDTGIIDPKIAQEIFGSNLYFMESNHDEFMLKEGLYPWHLKERIMSEEGHLSNRDAAIALENVLKGNKEIVLLGHLSKDNNVPELAYETVKSSLEEEGLNVEKDIRLGLSYRNKATEVFSI